MFWNGLNKTENFENENSCTFPSEPFVIFSKPMDFWMGTENFENENFEEKNENSCKYLSKPFVFFSKPMDFWMGTENFKNTPENLQK